MPGRSRPALLLPGVIVSLLFFIAFAEGYRIADVRAFGFASGDTAFQFVLVLL